MPQQSVLWNDQCKQLALLAWSIAWTVLITIIYVIGSIAFTLDRFPLFIAGLIAGLLIQIELVGVFAGWKRHYYLALTYTCIKTLLAFLALIATILTANIPGPATAIFQQCFVGAIVGYIYSCELSSPSPAPLPQNTLPLMGYAICIDGLTVGLLILIELLGVFAGWKRHYRLTLIYTGIKAILAMMAIIATIITAAINFPGPSTAAFQQCFVGAIVGYIYSCELAPSAPGSNHNSDHHDDDDGSQLDNNCAV
ncbi:uncharacterized protein LOC128956730 [Oppia nitens]|uniref:uncharacterized protein LOC128956730 n=1 Tax=Oppia nitens TaxID=1686743 RepID=UPI0023DA54DB|nr:uncharacterized protein LOC128956730 [Oppia nitens]